MKLKILFYSLMLSGALCVPETGYAQKEPDEIALANTEFENNFYEALKQKGIENYDKAIQSLQKCLSHQPDNAVIYNELGKNYLALKQYGDAENAFKKATTLDASNRWYWQGLYDVYYEIKDFNKAIPIVQKLMEWRKDYYQEDLVSLYMYTYQYDKALALIEEMDETVGISDKREMYKEQILSLEKYSQPKKEMLEEAIKKNPKEESNYLELIYLYSESNQEEKAQEVAKKLEKEIPGSDWAQVSLFKFHLNNNEGDKASEAMLRILGSPKIDSKIKHRVLNEFLIFTNNNPQYNSSLAKAVTYFKDDATVNVPKEVGKFFFSKQKYDQAAVYFEKGLQQKSDDIEGVELLLYSYEGANQNQQLWDSANKYIDYYPLQASLYCFAGVGANRLGQFKKAKEVLETGMEYVVEDPELEAKLNRELGEAYGGLGDQKKKELYFTKAKELLKSKIN
ncbi:tetratricopeptide repeat protein [Flavobacterium rhizosphaerae]|uniref:Tetratricopeptide repeat protein n=1 Tax=Flavobacterium rhizosphaerae TaxID=3163298 RepID=A0ABW8Z123_9FLAO